MGGVQRTTKFVKYLPLFGWNPIVLTVKDISHFTKDESLLDEIKNLKIYRTGSFDPLRIYHLLGIKKDFTGINDCKKRNLLQLINRLLFIPDNKILWLPFALTKSFFLAGKFDLIFTTAPPFSSHLAGLIIKKIFNIPLILDFRDGWTKGDFYAPPTLFHSRVNSLMEKFVIHYSDAVCGVSRDIIDKLRYDFQKKYYVVWNGFDEEDFPEKVEVDNSKFILTFGGTASRLTDPGIFAKVLKTAFSINQEFKENFLLNFVGFQNKDKILKTFKENGIPLEKLCFSGYIEHKKYVEQLLKSHILLFTISEGCSRGFITGRIFELLATGIKLLAIAPEGEVKDLIKKLKGKCVFSYSEVENASEMLVKEYEQWKKNSKMNSIRSPSFSREILEFSRKKITEKLANIFNEVVQQWK